MAAEGSWLTYPLVKSKVEAQQAEERNNIQESRQVRQLFFLEDSYNHSVEAHPSSTQHYDHKDLKKPKLHLISISQKSAPFDPSLQASPITEYTALAGTFAHSTRWQKAHYCRGSSTLHRKITYIDLCQKPSHSEGHRSTQAEKSDSVDQHLFWGEAVL